MFQKGFEAPAFDLDLLTYSVRAANVLVFTNHLCFRTFLRDVTIKLKHLQLSQRQIYISTENCGTLKRNVIVIIIIIISSYITIIIIMILVVVVIRVRVTIAIVVVITAAL